MAHRMMAVAETDDRCGMTWPHSNRFCPLEMQ
jgi:hypothetical protein